jgi:hypothetical protein
MMKQKLLVAAAALALSLGTLPAMAKTTPAKHTTPARKTAVARKTLTATPKKHRRHHHTTKKTTQLKTTTARKHTRTQAKHS